MDSVKESSTTSALPKSYQSFNSEKKFTFYSERTDVLQSDSLYNLSDHESLVNLMKDNVFWIDINRPTSADLNIIAEVFNVHPLTIEDILVRDSREKCEVFEKYLFLCVRTSDHGKFTSDGIVVDYPHSSNHTAATEPINLYILMFADFVISIHSEPISHIRHVLRRIYPLKNLFAVTSDWIMYALLDDVVDEFIPGMKTMELEVDSIDDLVLVLRQTDQADMLRRIGRARNRVTCLTRLLKPKTDIIKTLTKRTADRLQNHTLLYLRDIQDHLLTMIQNLDQSAETLNRSHNNYLAQISIELTEMSNKMNYQVKKLTAITSLVLPFSVIGALWGMNVAVPGQFYTNPELYKGLHQYIPFTVLCVSSVVLAVLFLMAGRKYDFF